METIRVEGLTHVLHFLLLYITTAAARALMDIPELSAQQVAEKAMDIASDMCVYTNKEFIIETMATNDEKEEEK